MGVVQNGMMLVVVLSSVAVAQTWTATHSTVTVESAPSVAIEIPTSPASILEPSWMIEVFYRGANQHLWDMVDTDLLTAGDYSNPVTLMNGTDSLAWKGKVVVFYAGTNGHLFIASKDQFQPLQAFNQPVDTGYGPLLSSPVVATLDNKEVDVFYRGGNSHLWQMHFKDLTHWSAPEDLNATIQSRPSVITMRDQVNKTGYQALYIGPNGHLWKSYYPSDLKKRIWWSGGEDLGGEVLTGGPISINLPTAAGGPTDRGIETFYLTDSTKGTDRLRFSTWVGYDDKGQTDSWSAPQAVTIPGANFTGDLGAAIFNVTGPLIYYRDGVSHFAKAMWHAPTPPPRPPQITTFSAAPDNGYVNKGTPVTLSWTVSGCSAPCSVAIQGFIGIGFMQPIYNAGNLGVSGSVKTTPSQTTTNTQYVLTAKGENGTSTKKLLTTLAPSGTSACSSCSTYYFKLTSDSPTAAPACFTQAMPAANEPAAQQLVTTENPGYTVTSTDYNGFLNGCN